MWSAWRSPLALVQSGDQPIGVVSLFSTRASPHPEQMMLASKGGKQNLAVIWQLPGGHAETKKWAQHAYWE